jgi:hypothetical protein
VVKLIAMLRDGEGSVPSKDYEDYKREKKSLTMTERRYR